MMSDYINPDMIDAVELKRRLVELRSNIVVKSFNPLKPNIDDLWVYVILTLDDFEQRLTQLEKQQ